MFIGLYCCLLVRVRPLSLAWADLHHTDSLGALFQGSIIEFRLGYPIFYLGTSEIFPPTLIEFENYVFDLMKNYAVSPKIFLTRSNFMKWWEEYIKVKGTCYSSRLTNLMSNAENYDKYATSYLVIHWMFIWNGLHVSISMCVF